MGDGVCRLDGVHSTEAHTSLQGPRKSQVSFHPGVTWAHVFKVSLVVAVEKIRAERTEWRLLSSEVVRTVWTWWPQTERREPAGCAHLCT